MDIDKRCICFVAYFSFDVNIFNLYHNKKKGQVCAFGEKHTENNMKTLIKCKELFDTQTGTVHSGMSIVVESDRIIWAGGSEDYQENADEMIDLSDKFVMPGLIDAHVHTCFNGSLHCMDDLSKLTIGDITLETILNAKKDLMAGFTTIRDEGSYGLADIAVRNAINAGKINGPRMFVSGHALTATGGHGDAKYNPAASGDLSLGIVVDSPDEGRKAARVNFKYGADQIKVMATGGVMSLGDLPGAPEFSEEEMKAILQVANSKGAISSAHAHGAKGIKMAVRAGITSIEHGMMMDDECIEMMVEKGIYLIPTIIAAIKIIELGTQGGLLEETINKAKMCIEKHAQNLETCRKKGVKIVFGTDAGTYNNFHGQQAYEFELMKKYGRFTISEMLLSATKTAAEMMKLNTGCIQAGNYADIIAFEKSPFEDIKIMSDVAFVMKGGKIFKNK